MANCGDPNTNASQFYITQKKADWLDNENVVFGRVTKGKQYLQEDVMHYNWEKSEHYFPDKI